MRYRLSGLREIIFQERVNSNKFYFESGRYAKDPLGVKKKNTIEFQLKWKILRKVY